MNVNSNTAMMSSLILERIICDLWLIFDGKYKAMQEPFDIEVGQNLYAVFPEGNDSYTIFKDGKEYIQIQKDTSSIWLKMDYKTELPIFEEDEEVNAIGQAIEKYVPEEEDEDEESI